MTATHSSAILDRLKSLYPKSIDLTLNRPLRLLKQLGNPDQQLPPVIHFAGTNGKGSTLAMVRAGLEAEGKIVHAYISPHLTKFHERIRLSGQLIAESELVKVLQESEEINGQQPISLFEITTCAAMLAFSRIPADFLLLEVGLGGRLDATNVITHPHLTSISPISPDHQEFLGNDVAAIAREKAGILKSGVPCVVSRQPRAAMQVIRDVARDVGAPLLVRGEEWDVDIHEGVLSHRFNGEAIDLPLPALVGPHQIGNAGAALALLRHIGVRSTSLSSALTDADWPARMQRLKSGPLVAAAADSELWLDGGHNKAAGQAAAQALQEMKGNKNGIVCGMLNSKGIGGYLSAMRSVAERLYGIAIPGEAASLSAPYVAETAQGLGFKAETAETAEQAVSRCATEMPGSRILICGSLYLAGNILRENG
ncbi:MAG: bifunctional folylpolyglutamate synthase/dihydrofolate synthase [Rhodobacteraceae bacterium]|nr:bifunctional folylpolyglutamate synthase/dihydrofolate synthase [Paracoccaceae bacterium]